MDKLKSKKPAPAAEKTHAAQTSETPAEAKAPARAAVKTPNASAAAASGLLLHPLLTEKGTHLASQGKYVFKVAPGANKTEVKKGVQAVYDVHVTSVKILKMPSKTRRYGRSVGHTSSFKKAIVSLRPGEKIAGIIESVG